MELANHFVSLIALKITGVHFFNFGLVQENYFSMLIISLLN
jgi:hypothetical protein